jgi:hypothetical protein
LAVLGLRLEKQPTGPGENHVIYGTGHKTELQTTNRKLPNLALFPLYFATGTRDKDSSVSRFRSAEVVLLTRMTRIP